MKNQSHTFIKSLAFLFCILAFALVSIACKSAVEEKKQIIITKIAYSSFRGDKGGNFFNLQISKDSTILVKGNRVSKETFKIATKQSLWEELIIINLDEFDKILSTRSRNELQHDGTITQVSISTNTTSHSFQNGNTNNSKEVSQFLDLLGSEIVALSK